MSRVYLAGPINGCSDEEAKDWRGRAKALFPDTLDPMDRDYRGREDEAYAQLVAQDKADIATADVVLVWFERPSVGTSMEILWAWLLHKRIVLVDKSNQPLSPWLRFHVSDIVHTLHEAWALL